MSGNNKSNCKRVEEIRETTVKPRCPHRTIDLACGLIGAPMGHFISRTHGAAVHAGAGHAERNSEVGRRLRRVPPRLGNLGEQTGAGQGTQAVVTSSRILFPTSGN